MTDKKYFGLNKGSIKNNRDREVRAMPVAVASLQTTDSKVQRAARHNLFVWHVTACRW